MNNKLSILNTSLQAQLFLAVAIVVMMGTCISQSCRAEAISIANGTNISAVIPAQIATIPKLPALTDFQRLQYYYAAQPNSPAPGAEHEVFTVGPNRKWNEDWNSKIVAKPTRQQLQAVTALQLDLFRRAAVYTNGAWRLAPSGANLALATVTTVSPEIYWQILLTAQRDRLQKNVQQLNQQLSKTTKVPAQ